MRITPARVSGPVTLLIATLFALVPMTPRLALAQEAPLVAPTEARTPAEERKGFHLPEGFEIQLVAAEPTINKPMNLGFDDKGRLWVTSSVEYPWPAKDGTTPRDRVVVLDDFGPDGLARRSTNFAEGLNIPIGLLPIAGGREALVHGIPTISRFVDADGDGKADRREPLFATYGSRDTHGMTNAFAWGFDGWIYACHGFNNESTVKGSDGEPITMQSGNIYRMKADGSHLEYVSHGQVNPFGLAFDPLGNLFSCDCHSRPVYQLLRGAYYPSFGKPHDGLGFGPEMMTHDHGSTGIAGITYYAADHFPPAYRDNIFVGNVVTSRINRDTLAQHGSTLLGVEQPDFLVSDDPWFRPVDIKLGPDGALYVADFYNRIIGHYEVPLTHPGRDRKRGRIWRIVYTGKDRSARPPASPRADWTAASIPDLIGDLSHSNLTARTKATNQLVGRGTEAIAPTRAALTASTWYARAHALWVLQRLGALDDAELAKAASDAEPGVRAHALRALGERGPMTDRGRAIALDGLKDTDAFARRAAAEALGRHPAAANIAPLLDAWRAASADDTHLIHAIRMAARDQLVDPKAWTSPAVTSAGLDDAYRLDEIALGVPSAESARYLVRAGITMRPAAGSLPMDDLVARVRHAARYGDAETTRALMTTLRGLGFAAPGVPMALLRAVQQGEQERGAGLDPDARAWAVELAKAALGSADGATVDGGAELAQSFGLAEAFDPLARLAASPAPEARRGAAIGAMAALDPARAVGPLAALLIDPAAPVAVREAAADALAKSNRPEARDRLLAALAAAPARVQTAIAAGMASGRPGAEALLAAVASGKASARLLGERAVQVRLDAAEVPDLAERLGPLTAGLPPTDRAMQALMASRRAAFAAAIPDPTRGAAVYAKNCAACHQLGGVGGRVGPQLDGVGIRGPERLTEDILDPDRNVDQAFRSTTLALADGRVVSGLLLREEGQSLVLADAQGKDVRVARDTVEARTTAMVSPMPASFADQIPEADFADLLAHLLRQRPADVPAQP